MVIARGVGTLCGVLNRLRASPWVRVGLLAAVLVFCGYGLVVDWPQVRPALGRLDWYSISGAALAAVAGVGCMMLAWREVLADLGTPLAVPAAFRIMFVAQLAKYVPGAVWAFAAQVELGHDYRVPRRRGATAVVIALALVLGVGLLIVAVALPVASAGAARQYWWALAITPLILIGLCPPVLGRLLDRALMLIRWPPLERRPSARGVARALAWTALGWLLWGLQAWVLVRDITGRGAHVLVLAFGAYAIAWSAGILIVVFPGGIGPREVALVAALAPVMPRGAALVIALISRVVMTASDLIWGAVGLAIGRWAHRPSTEPEGTEPLLPPPGQAAEPTGSLS